MLNLALRLLAALAILLAGNAVRPPSADACSCAGLTGDEARVREHYDYYDEIIVGRVERIETRSAEYGGQAHVTVEQRYKGGDAQTFVVIDGGNGGDCSYGQFAAGQRHLLALVPADGSRGNMGMPPVDGAWRANMCSSFDMSALDKPGSQYHDPRAFLATLARIAPPVQIEPVDASVDPIDADQDDNTADTWRIIAIGGGSMIAAFAASLVLRRRT